MTNKPTDAEIDAIVYEHTGFDGDVDFAEKVCRVVEKAHGIKQGGQHGTE